MENKETKMLKLLFRVGTNRVGSKVSEEIEIEVNVTDTEEQIEETIRERYSEWVWDNLDSGWEILG